MKLKVSNPACREALKGWVSALRSGKYTQTVQALKYQRGDEISFSADGVGCDNSELGRWVSVDGDIAKYRFYYADGGIDPKNGYMPDFVRDYYGIDLQYNYEIFKANDLDGMSFEEIADKIESDFGLGDD